MESKYENTYTQGDFDEIDVSMLAMSLEAIAKRVDKDEMDNVLKCVFQANMQGELSKYFLRVRDELRQGTDLASAFQYAYYDLFLNIGQF